MKAATALCAVLLLCGCSEKPKSSGNDGGIANRPDGPAGAAQTREACHQPLDAYCRGTECPDYDRSVAAVRSIGATGQCWAAVVGKCGTLRFTRAADGFVSGTEYFDAAGKLVAASSSTDVVSGNPDCPSWRDFGPPINCEMTQITDYCKHAADTPPPAAR